MNTAASQLAPSSRLSSKELLLASAAALFSERGYDTVSTREIAERAGVNLALIQYHFGSKAKLFLETVDFLTAKRGNPLETMRPLPAAGSPLQGAVELCHFAKDFLGFLLQAPCDAPCRLMYREVFSGSRDTEMFNEIVSFVVARYAGPLEERVTSLIRIILPQESAGRMKLAGRSIIGQCAFYVTHRPFIERLEGIQLDTPAVSEALARHISHFSLAGLGCPQKIIDEASSLVFGDSHSPLPEKL